MGKTWHHECRGKNKDGTKCKYIAKFSYPNGHKSLYCKLHKKSTMVNIRKTVCADIVCGKGA